ncbi:MAG: acryloyl-CoA reductase [Ndongobacter sp.]|nr:acryloyl-CoA reductase [Ndongobacter sp.]
MKIAFTQAEQEIQKVAQAFAENEVAPLAKEIDEQARFPEETFDKMVKLGFTGIGIPTEFGGSGGSTVAKVILVSEIAKKCASTAAILSIHGVFQQGVYQFGTKEQKEFYLPQVTSGGKHGAFALTEPDAGSDAAAVKTTAVLDGDEYVLNGTKCFITGGNRADYVLVIASTDRSKGVKGLTAFIVPKEAPGFSVGKVEDKFGIRASDTAELIFQDCRIPKENMLGKEGAGFRYAMILLDAARIGIAAQAVGIAEGALELATQYMNERVQFGKPIAALQGLQWYIADMATRTEAAKWLTFRAASLHDEGAPFGKEAAMAKLFAAETSRFVANLAQQIHGGYGYMRDYPIERYVRDAKVTEVYEGTSEIQKVVISRYVLG